MPIPEKTKERRVAKIMALQQEISAAGTPPDRDRHEGDHRQEGGLFLVGRSQHDSPEVDQEILITGAGNIEPGTFIDVKITGSTEFDLYAEVRQ
jgi:ribosomal protein S12 methylthiotransferase